MPKKIVFLLLAAAVVLAAMSAPAEAQRGRRSDDAPKVGEVAPNFKLKMLNGETEVELAGFAGKTPVVLIFGSYT